MNSFSDIISCWETFSVDVGVTSAQAAVWKHRDKIPDRYWKRTVEAAIKAGKNQITLDLLADLAAKRALRSEAAE